MKHKNNNIDSTLDFINTCKKCQFFCIDENKTYECLYTIDDKNNDKYCLLDAESIGFCD